MAAPSTNSTRATCSAGAARDTPRERPREREPLDFRIEAVARAINAVAHFVGGPIQSAVNYNFVFRKRHRDAAPEIFELLDRTDAQFDELRRRIETLRVLYATCDKPALERCLSGALVEDVLGSLAPEQRARVSAEISDVPFVVDALQVRHALNQILKNAFDFSPAESPVELNVAVAGASVFFAVVNSSAQALPSPKEAAIDPFYTTKARSLGLGLALAHAVARAHGGRLELESLPDGRVCVTLRLPREVVP